MSLDQAEVRPSCCETTPCHHCVQFLLSKFTILEFLRLILLKKNTKRSHVSSSVRLRSDTKQRPIWLSKYKSITRPQIMKYMFKLLLLLAALLHLWNLLNKSVYLSLMHWVWYSQLTSFSHYLLNGLFILWYLLTIICSSTKKPFHFLPWSSRGEHTWLLPPATVIKVYSVSCPTHQHSMKISSQRH